MAEAKDSLMIDAKSPSIPISTPPRRRPFSIAQAILRISAIVFTAASIVVMVTNSQTITIMGFQFESHFYYSSALKFMVVAEAIVCVFSIVTLIILSLLSSREGSQRRHYYFILFLHDIVMTVLMISGCAAATAVGYVGQYGESHVGWQAICNRVGKFCRTNLVSVLLSYLAFFAYLGLTILMAYKMISSPPKD